MELYTKNDVNLVDEHIESIVNDIEVIRKQLYPRTTDNSDEPKPEKKPDPPLEDVKEIVEITLKFISDKKRKIYGGYSHNNVIKMHNKSDAIYSDSDAPDIDVYTPTPIEDLVELCNILHENGFTDVIGKEAQHSETYKIFTKGYNAIDLSYVPKNIYNNIPFVEIEGIRYVHPSFSMIDLYKMMSEPLFSSWRWPKIFKRLQLLQKYYPIHKMSSDLTKTQNVYRHKNDISNVMSVVEEFITNNKNIYLFGDYAYNYLIEKSETTNKSIKPVNMSIYRIVSTNYKNDSKQLIKMFKNKNIQITYKEYYPLWTLTGYSVELLYKGEIFAVIYHNMKRCCPTIETNKSVQIGSFDYLLLMEMIMSFKQKVLRDDQKKKYHDTIVTNMILLREEYLKSNKLTLLDPSIFQSFNIPCIGDAVDPITEAQKHRKEKKEKNMTTFMYKPVRELTNKWIFANTSGNEIHNPKNLKIKI